jgi:hypothetical protein
MQLHMMAVHGPNSAQYQLRAAQWEKRRPQKSAKRSQAKGGRRKPQGKKLLKYPRHSKLS